MLLAGLSFAVMSALAKVLAGRGYTGMELVFYRSALGWLILAGWLALSAGAEPVWRGGHRGLLLRRSLVGFIALFGFFYAIVHLPVSLAVTLNYTSPLFLALLLPLTLGEHTGPRHYLAVALGFAGVVLILRPWSENAPDLAAVLVGLFSGFMAGVAYLHVRHMGRVGIGTRRVVLWFTAFCTVAAGVFVTLAGWRQPAVADLGGLLGMGVSATLGQLAVTRAYRYGHAAVTAGFAYSTVIFSSLLDVLLWPHPWPWQAPAGMALTVLAGLYAMGLNKGKDDDRHQQQG